MVVELIDDIVMAVYCYGSATNELLMVTSIKPQVVNNYKWHTVAI